MADFCVIASVLLQVVAIGVVFGAATGLTGLGNYAGVVAVIMQSGATGILAGVLFYLNHQQRKDHKEEKFTLRQERNKMIADIREERDGTVTALHEFYQKTISGNKKDHREEMATGAQIVEEKFERVLSEMAEFRNKVLGELATVARQLGEDKAARTTEMGGETRVDRGKRGV